MLIFPSKTVRKRYTERQKYEKYLIFFKNEIKIFGNCGNLYENYDKIEVIEYLPSLNGKDLPVGIRTVIYSEYVYDEYIRTDEELNYIAKYKTNANISLALADGELLSKKEDYSLDDSGITLSYTIRTIENIARTQEIKLEGFPERRK